MPWRETRDPYRIWVSEIMLQQTQVATAIPYYERFVTRFPDVHALAGARLDRVLAAWAGLGYYRRARHLHEAAGIVVREHAGRVPSDARAFARLPGVGRYTLGAVLSMGFGAWLPVLDGNVARVLARLSARALSVRRPAQAKRLWAMAEELMSRAGPARTPGARALSPDRRAARGRGFHPGDWNQALMELGALVCTPRAPHCAACPVRRHCRGYELGRPEAFPAAATPRATRRVRRAMAVLADGGRVLVVRRSGALLAGLWEPPGVELGPRSGARRALARMLDGLGIRTLLSDTGVRLEHAITNRRIRVELWRADPVGKPPRMGPEARWARAGSRALALTALARRVIEGAPQLGQRNVDPRAARRKRTK